MNERLHKLKQFQSKGKTKTSIIYKTAAVVCGVSMIVSGFSSSASTAPANAAETKSIAGVEKVLDSSTLDQSRNTDLQVSPILKTSKNTSEVENITLSGSSKVTSSKPRYVTVTKINPRSGKSSGYSMGSATPNYYVWGTGRTSSGHTEIKFFGKNAWVKSNQLKRVTVANYTTKKITKMYSSISGGKVVTTIPNDYTLGSLTNSKNKNRVQLQFKGKTGWVNLKDLKSVSINRFEGPGSKSYSNAEWAKAIQNNMSKYCKNIPIKVSNVKGQYFAESYPLTITMSRNGNNDPYSPMIKAISLHECAHILTFKLYPTDFSSKLVKYADKINPNKDKIGAEHLADCMSDKMGAKRAGRTANGGTYWAGYGGKCTSAQNSAASKLLAGKRVN